MIHKFALGVSLAVLGSVAAQAADLIIPTTPQPIMESYGFDWEGMYIGARAGGQFFSAAPMDGVIGAAVGVNFIPADPFLVGVEVTGDYIWNTGFSASEFFANLRAGAIITDAALVYAIGGVGVYTTGAGSAGVYQLGGGVEFAVTDAITVRGEVVGQGDFNGGADPFFEAGKATVGVFYHF